MKMNRVALPALVATLVLAGGLALRKDLAFASDLPETQHEPFVLDIPQGYEVVPASEERTESFSAPESVLEPGAEYAVLIRTSAGNVLIELYADRVPNTVNNFVFLALNRYYDGIVFHRVLEDFMAQTGDPTGTGTGGPGYEFEDEFHPELRHDSAGILSMANAGPGTNGSQFFITFRDTPHLDDRHSVFGKVIDGLEVLDQITRIDPGQPSVVVPLSDSLADAAAQGIELAGNEDTVLQAYLEAELGELPGRGRTFSIDDHNAMLGTTREGELVAGFWPVPDFMEQVVVLKRIAEE